MLMEKTAFNEEGTVLRIGVECGGTFTDLVALDESGALQAAFKVFSTPHNPSEAVKNAISQLPEEVVRGAKLLHGSTVATNALLERKGARIGLIVTEGFRDLVFLQRQDRVEMYNLKLAKPEPLVERENIYEVSERLDASGNVVTELDESQVIKIAEDLKAKKIESVAISLLHSYRNPEHERQIAKLLKERLPHLSVAASSEVAREFREYERTTTVTIDAFLRPRINSYLNDLTEDAERRGFESVQVMQSNGGMVPSLTAAANPLTMLRSGPAAGVAGAIAVAKAASTDRVVTMDMGGTSTDVAVIHGDSADLTSESVADGLPLRVPMVDIVAVGAGGGSIADVDSGGLLTVGPESAGANPGPVSYGLGGESVTVTDANVVRGIIRPEKFLGGDGNLDLAAATSALTQLGEKVGRSAEQLAEDIFELASVHMASAIRMTTTERGYEVTDYTLCAYGGAGSLHAASVADQLKINRVIIPPYNGLASAYGLLTAGFRREFSKTDLVDLGALSNEQLGEMLVELRDEAESKLKSENVNLTEPYFKFSADMRYKGQGFEVLVDFPENREKDVHALFEEFTKVQERRYGFVDLEKEVQLVTLRLNVSMAPPAVVLPRTEISGESEGEPFEIVEGGKHVIAKFYQRSELSIGKELDGPLVVEDAHSTTFVPSAWQLTIDPNTNIILTRREN
jgi:N-methylhydantoinase A